VNTIREEYPELFDNELEERILKEAKEAFEAESKIVDWMLNGSEEPELNPSLLKEFIKNRINDSMKQIGFAAPFTVNKEALASTQWFEEELLGNNMTDFFHSRPTEYSKKNQSFGEEDLF
jgi:ribonucleoside-diphosphate reductase beta chain